MTVPVPATGVGLFTAAIDNEACLTVAGGATAADVGEGLLAGAGINTACFALGTGGAFCVLPSASTGSVTVFASDVSLGLLAACRVSMADGFGVRVAAGGASSSAVFVDAAGVAAAGVSVPRRPTE